MPVARHATTQVFDLKPAVVAAPPAAAPAGLTPYEMQAVRHLGDTLIPPHSGLPGAGEILIGGDALAGILRSRPDLAPLLSRALLGDAGSFHTVAATDTEAWLGTLTVVAQGYGAHADVRAVIGYDGQVARPLRPDNYPDYIDEGLLDHLLDGRWAAERKARGQPHESAGTRRVIV